MSIAKQIILRYHAEGHVRFAVPAELCQPQAVVLLQAALTHTEGIYRVDLYTRQQKLSIRYLEGVTDLKAVAQSLSSAVAKIEELPAEAPACCAGQVVAAEEPAQEPGWLHGKYQEARETVTALGIIARGASKAQPILLTPEKEKFVIDFFTDILVLYLIKLHWHMIMGHWIRSPWQYRSEWMATLYLIFLLVRSKKPKK